MVTVVRRRRREAPLARRLLWGAAAGAAGTAVLNLTTYLDMAVRGRPASQVPAEVAEDLAGQAGVDLAAGGDEQTASARKTALGALLGFATGLGMGAALGAARPLLRGVPQPLLAVGLAAAAAAGANGPAVALGETDPSEWGLQGWLADIIPHLAYGAATVAVHDALAE